MLRKAVTNDRSAPIIDGEALLDERGHNSRTGRWLGLWLQRGARLTDGKNYSTFALSPLSAPFAKQKVAVEQQGSSRHLAVDLRYGVAVGLFVLCRRSNYGAGV